MKVFRNIKADFTDERGDIIKLLDDGQTTAKSILMITCAPGSVRANHYHKTDWHYCYMLKGKMEYVEHPLGEPKKLERVILNEGDMVYTAPTDVHAMKFPEDSIFLVFARNSRSQLNYESDTVRVAPLLT